MARASKDLAKRLRFDRFPRPDTFRRWYWLAGLVFVAGGAAAWYGFHATGKQRQYLPGPMSQVHASFGDRCETCHRPYGGVPTEACLGCHADRTHSELEVTTPTCASCHVEHRASGVFLAVANASCVECHGALQTTKTTPDIQAAIRSFADHPELGPRRPGRRDEAAVRFNHHLHLSTTKIASEDRLACASCHVPAGDGGLMRPIVFEQHCQRCHAQGGLGPDSSIEVVHEDPEIVREDLRAKLLVAAVRNPDMFASTDPGLPGRVRREPLDASTSLAAFIDATRRDSALAKAEAKLYAPLDPTRGEGATSLLDNNKLCFLCHDEDGTRAAGELPRIKPTKIPARWLVRGEFSHRTHDLLKCEHCHADARDSAATADVDLPDKAVCQRCHIDGAAQSAGTSCMLCHLYHDTSKDGALRNRRRKEVTIEAIFGREAPGAPAASH
jgi:hypothetical protein